MNIMFKIFWYSLYKNQYFNFINDMETRNNKIWLCIFIISRFSSWKVKILANVVP